MGKYYEDWRASEIGAPMPAGWSKMWAPDVAWTVEADKRAPGGKRVTVAPTSSARAGLRWNALRAIAQAVAAIEVVALVELTEAGAVGLNTYGGPMVRAGGQAGDESALVGAFGNGAAKGDALIRASEYRGGQVSVTLDDVAQTWELGQVYWLRLTVSGGQWELALHGFIPGEPEFGDLLAQVSGSAALLDAGDVGLFAFTAAGTLRILAVGVGTDGDAAPLIADGATILDPVDLSEPGPTDPGPTDPTDPGPTDPGPVDPGPTDPDPVDPDPTDPQPSDPTPLPESMTPEQRVQTRATALDLAVRVAHLAGLGTAGQPGATKTAVLGLADELAGWMVKP